MSNHYRLQNGCWNCRHRFLYYEYDEHDRYYCTKDAPARPPCMSAQMSDYSIGDYMDGLIAWDAWADGRLVHIQGICDNYKSV